VCVHTHTHTHTHSHIHIKGIYTYIYIYREHISIEKTFNLYRTHSIYRECVLYRSIENTFCLIEKFKFIFVLDSIIKGLLLVTTFVGEFHINFSR
jgi:hypothetical protein